MLHTVIKQKLDCRSLHPYLLRSTSLLLVNLLHLFVKSRNLGVMRITRICILWYCHSYITQRLCCPAANRRANYQRSRASKRWLAKTAKLQRNSTAIEYAEWPPQQWTRQQSSMQSGHHSNGHVPPKRPVLFLLWKFSVSASAAGVGHHRPTGTTLIKYFTTLQPSLSY